MGSQTNSPSIPRVHFHAGGRCILFVYGGSNLANAASDVSVKNGCLSAKLTRSKTIGEDRTVTWRPSQGRDALRQRLRLAKQSPQLCNHQRRTHICKTADAVLDATLWQVIPPESHGTVVVHQDGQRLLRWLARHRKRRSPTAYMPKSVAKFAR